MASYGTRLGLAYLVKYPQHVQNIVLDGNIAPSNQLTIFDKWESFGWSYYIQFFFSALL